MARLGLSRQAHQKTFCISIFAVSAIRTQRHYSAARLEADNLVLEPDADCVEGQHDVTTSSDATDDLELLINPS